MTDGQYWIVIALTTVGFFGLAALLLVPVYRFLLREEEVAKKWTGPRRDGKDGDTDSDPSGVDPPSVN